MVHFETYLKIKIISNTRIKGYILKKNCLSNLILIKIIIVFSYLYLKHMFLYDNLFCENTKWVFRQLCEPREWWYQNDLNYILLFKYLTKY